MKHTAPRQREFNERLVIDPSRGEWRDGDVRYLLIRHDSLMGMFRRLPETARRQAFAAFCGSVAEHGGRSAGSYLAPGAGSTANFLRIVETTAPQLGWGRWKFDQADPNELHLEVENSPFAAGFGLTQEPVCAPIRGMLSAVASIVFGAPAHIEETTCAAVGANSCRFRARPATAGSD